MKDILKQIQEATEKFDNLFEVDGLGDPASDVPPSTNKIKKDVKTKNGKVELVSVEDELFPKEGNAKEQFRQKIIDKINGMIQGTATLEDLLQLVRSKQVKPVKEGFEGAIEILEEIINELKDSTIENALKKRSDAVENSTMGFYFPSKESVDKFGKLKELADRRATRQGKKLEEIGDTYGYTYKHKPVKEGFEGAIEILEEIINEVSVGKLAKAAENSFPAREKENNELEKKRQENHREGSKTKSKKKIDNLYKELQDILGKSITANKRYNQAKNIVDLNLPKNSKTSVSKLANSAKKSQIGRGEALSVERNKSDNDFDYGKYERAHKRVHRANDIADIKKNKDGVNEAFEQAISQIEGLINCLGESKSVTELPSVAKRVLPQREEEAKKAHASLDNVMRVNPYSMINGKLSQKQRDNIANALNRVEKADNKVAKAKAYLEKPKEKQSSTEFKFDKILCNFEEAMDIIEATVGKLATSSVNSVEPRRKEYQDLAGKAQKATGADKITLNAQKDKAKKRYAHALELNMLHLPKDSKVSANKLFKAADKSVEGRKRQGSNKRYARAWNIADANPLKDAKGIGEALKALESLEDKINKEYNKAFKKTNEGLFVNDGRGDLVDDISKCLTKKTVKQHLVDTAKKLMKPKNKLENK